MVNEAYCRTYGYDRAELIGQPFTMVLPDEQRQHAELLHDRFLMNGDEPGGEWKVRHKDGRIREVLVTAGRAVIETGERYKVTTVLDVTDQRTAETELRKLSFYDRLTGLPNRRLLEVEAQSRMQQSELTDNFGSLILIGLDNFKLVNDMLGFSIGDNLLIAAGRALRETLPSSSLVARLGGDEFAILVSDLASSGVDAAERAEHIIGAICENLKFNAGSPQRPHPVSFTVGAVLFKGTDVSFDQLLQQADIALNDAKSETDCSYRFFDRQMQSALRTRHRIEQELACAISSDQLVPLYQAQWNQHNEVVGVELLIRWQHPSLGMLEPGKFIPLAENNGLIHDLGAEVLEIACRQLSEWQMEAHSSALILAVNISPQQFRKSRLLDCLKSLLTRYRFPSNRLKLEVTEQTFIHESDKVIEMMREIHSLGVTFSLDDFGTGYSSLGYLKEMPISELKIDKRFVMDICTSTNDFAICKAIIALAENFNTGVIAEGVETLEQKAALLQMGCFNFQGHYFSPAEPVADLLDRLRLAHPDSLQDHQLI